MGKSRIKPEDPFPEDLNQLEDDQVEVLNSKVHRQLEVEYVHEGGPDPETEHRREELSEELDDRDLLSETQNSHRGSGTPHADGKRETPGSGTPASGGAAPHRQGEPRSGRRSDQRR